MRRTLFLAEDIRRQHRKSYLLGETLKLKAICYQYEDEKKLKLIEPKVKSKKGAKEEPKTEEKPAAKEEKK